MHGRHEGRADVPRQARGISEQDHLRAGVGQQRQ